MSMVHEKRPGLITNENIHQKIFSGLEGEHNQIGTKDTHRKAVLL